MHNLRYSLKPIFNGICSDRNILTKDKRQPDILIRAYKA